MHTTCIAGRRGIKQKHENNVTKQEVWLYYCTVPSLCSCVKLRYGSEVKGGGGSKIDTEGSRDDDGPRKFLILSLFVCFRFSLGN